MKKSPYRYFLFLLILLGSSGCDPSSTGGTETGNPNTDVVSVAMLSSLDVVSSTLASGSTTSTAALSLEALNEGPDNEEISALSLPLSSGGCSESDSNVQITTTCSESSHTASIIKDLNDCEGGSNSIVSGTLYTSWYQMGTGSCSSATKRPRFSKAIQGTGARQIISTDALPSDQTCGTPKTPLIRKFIGGTELRETGCRILDYSNFSSATESMTETLTLENINRVKLRSSGAKAFDHTISTPTPLVTTLNIPSSKAIPKRTIQSGEVDVSHNLANFTVHHIYQNVIYDYSVCDCQPIDGSIGVTVTDNKTGSTLGSGTITFTESTTGTCNSVTATYQGQSLSLNLGSCRGF